MRVVTVLCTTVALIFGCQDAAGSLGPEAAAAVDLRPIGDVQLLPKGGPKPPRRDAALVPDSKIAWTVRQSLADAGLRVEVAVARQAVVLSGTVPAGKKQTAEDIARSVRGVAAVHNELVEESK